MSLAHSSGPLRNLVVKNPYGQLGNRLYRLGNLFAFALEHNLRVYDFAFHDSEYGLLFETTRAMPFVRFNVAVDDGLGDDRQTALAALAADAGFVFNDDDEYELDIESLNDGGAETVVIEGFHFQSDDLVAHWRDRIVAFFTPVAETRHRVDSSFAELRKTVDTVVGVHIRQGDFKQWNRGASFFEPSAYAARMRQFAALRPSDRLCFLVFSDEQMEPAWFPELPVFFSKGSMIDDLYSLSLCDYIIAPPQSTFSGWSSFYGQVPMYHMSRDATPLELDNFRANEFLNNT